MPDSDYSLTREFERVTAPERRAHGQAMEAEHADQKTLETIAGRKAAIEAETARRGRTPAAVPAYRALLEQEAGIHARQGERAPLLETAAQALGRKERDVRAQLIPPAEELTAEVRGALAAATGAWLTAAAQYEARRNDIARILPNRAPRDVVGSLVVEMMGTLAEELVAPLPRLSHHPTGERGR